jgi:phosphoserine phosphatase
MIHLKSVISHQRIRLVIFDLDGTITRSPNVWRHLHEELGTWNSGRIFAQQYLNGEISYREWAQLDCSLWKGTRLEELLRITSRMD